MVPVFFIISKHITQKPQYDDTA